MKRLVAAGLLTLMLVAGIWVGGPYYTLHRLHVAIEARDAASLENQVDFPLLRENIKLQFHARAAQAAPPRWRESPLAGLAMGLTVQLVDGAVDALVTPAGLLGFLEQQTMPVERDIPTPDDAADPAPSAHREVRVRDVRTRFDSPSRFEVQATTPQGNRLRIILSRQGLKWRLTNLIVPDWSTSLAGAAKEDLR